MIIALYAFTYDIRSVMTHKMEETINAFRNLFISLIFENQMIKTVNKLHKLHFYVMCND